MPEPKNKRDEEQQAPLPMMMGRPGGGPGAHFMRKVEKAKNPRGAVLRARADEAAVLDDHGPRAWRLEHAADPDSARQVAVFSNLRATPYGGPRVDHRPATYASADVDVTRHDDDTRLEELHRMESHSPGASGQLHRETGHGRR